MVGVLTIFSLPLPFVVAVVVVVGGADADAPATPAPLLADAELLAPPPFVVVVDFFPLSFLDNSRKTKINKKGGVQQLNSG